MLLQDGRVQAAGDLPQFCYGIGQSLRCARPLRRHVLLRLCGHDQLDPSQTPLHQAVITRSGRPCGLFFQVQGPRLVKTYAVWAGEEDRILFYDSGGARFAQLPESMRARAMRQLEAWALVTFGSLTRDFAEPHSFELQVFRFDNGNS